MTPPTTQEPATLADILRAADLMVESDYCTLPTAADERTLDYFTLYFEDAAVEDAFRAVFYAEANGYEVDELVGTWRRGYNALPVSATDEAHILYTMSERPQREDEFVPCWTLTYRMLKRT